MGNFFHVDSLLVTSAVGGWRGLPDRMGIPQYSSLPSGEGLPLVFCSVERETRHGFKRAWAERRYTRMRGQNKRGDGYGHPFTMWGFTPLHMTCKNAKAYSLSKNLCIELQTYLGTLRDARDARTVSATLPQGKNPSLPDSPQTCWDLGSQDREHRILRA